MRARDQINKRLKKLITHKTITNYSELFDIIGDYNPFLLKDDVGKETIKLLSIIYQSINQKKAKRLKYYLACDEIKAKANEAIVCSLKQYYKSFSESLFNEVINQLYFWSYDTELLVFIGLESQRKGINSADVCLTFGDNMLQNDDYTSFINDITNLNYKAFCCSDSNIVARTMFECLSLVDSRFTAVPFEMNCISSGEQIIVFGPQNCLESIYYSNSKKCHSFFRSIYNNDNGSECILFASYQAMASIVYGFDFLKSFSDNRTLDFSIIIPIKSFSKEYLDKTILSCLNQKTNHSYEILISINDPSFAETDTLLKQFGSYHCIRIIKTPFALSLSRSFEFAYLNSRGKYLLSIGADDAIVPDALDKIYKAFESYNNDVVMWKMAFFYWQDINNDNNPSLTWEKINSDGQMEEINFQKTLLDFGLGNNSYLNMPNMYLKTCVYYKHVLKIIEKTGKFEDGFCQDVYTGFINCMIESSITLINSNLTIAGSSKMSTGMMAAEYLDFKIVNRRAAQKILNYRFSNYYPKKYEILSFPFGFGNDAVSLREYVKLVYCFSNPLNSDIENAILLRIIELYASIPFKNCDDKIISYQLYLFLLKKGNNSFSLKMKRIIKNAKLFFLNFKIINKMVIASYALRKKRRVNQCDSDKKYIISPNSHINFDKNTDILEAAKYV